MKKMINLLFVFSILFNMFAPLTVSSSNEIILGRVTSTNGLRLRTSPSIVSDSNIILTLNYNDYVTITGKVNNIDGCGNFWYTVSYNGANGVVCSNLIEVVTITPAEIDTNFPESYKVELAKLQALRPNWKFEAVHTNIDWNDLIEGENPLGRNLIQTKNDGWKNILSYNFDSGTFFNKYSGGGSTWFAPSDKILAYYLDPRNFLTEGSVFMFETLSFDINKYTSDELVRMKSGIQRMLDSTFMKEKPILTKEDRLKNMSYADIFMEAAKVNKVSPYFLVSRVIQEVSKKRTTIVSGTVKGYEGYFNFYNIGATGAIDSIITNGLKRAISEGWNSEYDAIVGGARFVARNYINRNPQDPTKNQDTLYTQKFNVVSPTYFANQYMQNIQAPASEASATAKAYRNEGLLTENFIFKIPVFLNMPSKTSVPPTGSPINHLKDVKVDGKTLIGFDRDTLEYTINVPKTKTSINVAATPYVVGTSVSGIGNINITNSTSHVIKSSALNGDVKTYKINIVKTDSEVMTIDEVLDASKLSYNSDAITGLKLSTNMEMFKENLIKQSSDLIINVKDANGDLKTKGNIGTGDIITITLGSETKEIKAIVPGDINGDGLVSISDLIRTQKYLLKMSELNSVLVKGADVNQDGKVNVVDLLKMQKHLLNIEIIR